MTKFIRDSTLSLIGNASQKAVQFIGLVYVARALGPESFGIYGLVSSIVLFFLAFSLLGVQTSIIPVLSSSKDTLSEKLSSVTQLSKIILLLSLAFAAILFLLIPVMTKIFGDAEIEITTRLAASFHLFFLGVFTYSLGLMYGAQLFKHSSFFQLICAGIALPLFLLLPARYGVAGAILAIAIPNAIFAMLCTYTVLNLRKKKCANSIKNSSTFEIIKGGVPLGLGDVFYNLCNLAIVYILTVNSDLVQLGLYGAANQWYAIIIYVPSVISLALLSHLSKTEAKGSKKLAQQNIKYGAVFSISIALLLYAALPYIVAIYGQEFVGIDEVLVLTLATAPPTVLLNIYIQAIIARKQYTTASVLRACNQFIVIIFAILFVSSENSAYTLALIRLLSFALVCVLAWAVFRRHSALAYEG